MKNKSRSYRRRVLVVLVLLILGIAALINSLIKPEETQQAKVEYTVMNYDDYIKSVEVEVEVEVDEDEDELARDVVDKIIADAEDPEGEIVYAKITYYCAEQYPHICNSGDGDYHTASGTIPTPNRTVAVDRSRIPLGSTIIIGGQEYIAEDVFGTDKNQYRVDILVETHQEALELGVQYAYIEILK